MEAQATPQAPRFFCHSCNTEIDHIEDFKCPRCLLGFIEELPRDEASPPPINDADNQVIRFANEIFNNPLLTPILMSTSGARPGDAYPGEGSSDDGGRLGRRVPRRDYNISNFDTILQDILISVGGSEVPSLFFTGNPADYAWGREGLDTIVSQLLNQMDNTGPPPLEKEKIDEIPKVKVEQEQVDAKMQCSVCWEDFELDEPVRRLPCSHIYHENCIVPWLTCHGTCPICRKSLVQEGGTDQQRNSLSAAAQAVANTIRNAMRPGSSSSSDTASTSATTSNAMDINSPSSTTTESNNLFTPSSFLNPNATPFPPTAFAGIGRAHNHNSVTSSTSPPTISPTGGINNSLSDTHREKDADGYTDDYDFD